jgi:uncharacterized protein HemX
MKFLKDFGALVAIALAAGGGLIAWGKVTSRQDAHEERLNKIEPKVGEHDTGLAVLNSKTDAVLKALDRLEDKLGTK